MRLGGTVRVWVIALAAIVGACDINAFHIGGDNGGRDGGRDGGGDGDGGGDDDGGSPDAGDGGVCVPRLETCNQQDDDCDSRTDEDYNLNQDPANCGQCGMACTEPTQTMVGTCAGGTCAFACRPGRIDLDPGTPGCEYACTPTNGGNEGCDFSDNDCDGRVDEGIDTVTSVQNCGGCGRVCSVLHAVEECRDVDSDGDGDCTYSACDAGFGDLLPAVPGCEYTCPVFPTTAEACNFVDDDCDGRVDEGNIPGVGASCTAPGFSQQADVGHCEFGQTACVAGSIVCAGYVGPLPDAPGGRENACNTEDDDCDTRTDEGYDLQTDVRNCGMCGRDCTLPGVVPNAIAACSAGTCGHVACLSGWVDLDPAMPGCDYQCTRTGEIDVCDGVDNDCDGDIDDEVTLPGPGFCPSTGACSGATVACSFDPCANRTRIHCTYGAGVELDAATCNIADQESRCDNLDNDCDAATDESFPAKHDALACSDGHCALTPGQSCDPSLSVSGCPGGASCVPDTGVCRRTGVFACNAQGDGVRCDFSASLPDVMPSAETCNGRDEDCDGTTDEGAPDDMVTVTDAGGQPQFRVYTYEASRPDATTATIAASPTGATQSGTTATITTTTAHGLGAGYPVFIFGVAVAGYNGNYTVASVVSPTRFTIVLGTAGLAPSGGGQLASVGTMSGRSCSRAGVLPWASITQSQAAAACTAAGARLCTAAEWELACAGNADLTYPYGNAYQPNTCNGNDFDPDGAPPDDDRAVLTGQLNACVAPFVAFDLSGNLKEWTSTQTSPGYFNIRGGGFDTAAGGLTCGFDFVSGDTSFQYANLGFRCCANP